MSNKLFSITILIAIVSISSIESKHVYLRYRRSLERESDIPTKESTVIAQGQDADNVHNSVRDFSNEIASNEKGVKDFLEIDYNPRQDLLRFSGHMPHMFQSPHMQMFEKMMQQMLAQTQSMFENFPVHSFNNYPANYNGTTESEVIIGGRRFKKKEKVINKSDQDTQLSLISTIYEPIDEDITTMLPNKDGVTEGPIVTY